jgi:predicted PurR-regulated permease PerM
MLGSLLVVAGMISVIVMLVFVLAPMVQTEAATIARRLPELVDRINERFVPWLKQHFDIDPAIRRGEHPRAHRRQRQRRAEHRRMAARLVADRRLALVGFFANLLLTPVVMFYLLDRLGRAGRALGGAPAAALEAASRRSPARSTRCSRSICAAR